MGLGSLIGKWFGGGGSGEGASTAVISDPVEYEGFSIIAAPLKEGGQYKTAGSIQKEVDGVSQSSRFIRADNHADQQSAIDHSIRKARQIIDEQGLRLFDRENV